MTGEGVGMTAEFESRLETLSKLVPEGQLRLFGCECCKRLLTYWRNPILLELIALGEARSVREVAQDEIDKLCNRSTKSYDNSFNDFDDPSAETFAIGACGEVAFTKADLTAAIGAADFAAEAIAQRAAEKVHDINAPDSEYDKTFRAEFADERMHQERLLTSMFGS
jgi:hypothetical protein